MISLSKKCVKPRVKASCALAKRGRTSFKYALFVCSSTRLEIFRKVQSKLRVPHDIRYTGSFGVDSSYEFFCSDSRFHLLDLCQHRGYKLTQCHYPVGHPYHGITQCSESRLWQDEDRRYNLVNINSNTCRKDLYEFLD